MSRTLQKLKPLLETPHTHNVLRGGRGGGKSQGAASLLVKAVAHNPLNIFCGRETQKSLVESSFAEVKDEIYLQDYSDRFNIVPSKSLIESASGGRFSFVGLKDHTVDSIKSYKGYHWAWIEEAHAVTAKSLNTLIPTLRTDGHVWIDFGGLGKYRMPLRMFIYTENPYTWDDPINVVLPESRDDVQVIDINYWDNPYFPESLEEERIQAEKTMLPEEYARIWEGIPYEDAERAIMSRAAVKGAMSRKASRDGGIVVGADIARFGADRTVFIKREGMQVIDVKVLSKKDTQEVARRLFDFADGGRIVVDDTGVGCIVPGTLVLTPSGWVRVEKLRIGDEIYSKDKDSNVVIEHVRDNVRREETRIIECNGFEYSHSHIMPYKTRTKYPFKQTSWENILERKYVTLDSEFKYAQEPGDIEFPEYVIEMPHGGERRIHDKKTISGDIFCAFLGWFVSEGHLDGSDQGIMITQMKQKNIQEIYDLCSAIGKPQRKKDGIKVFNKPVYDWLRENCYRDGMGARYITVPRFVSNNSRENIDIFLEAFALGDGSFKGGVRYYYTSSKWLPNDILELIYKIGKRGNIYLKHTAGNKSHILGREITRRYDHYCIFEYKQNKYDYNTCIKTNNTKERYDNVYELCITGESKQYFSMCPNSTRPIWTHNGGVTDKLKDLAKGKNINITPVNFGSRARNKKKYPDIISEMWFELADIMGEIGLPNDNELLQELSSRHYKYTQDERRKVESKEEFKKRTGRRSPDVADALILAFRSHGGEMSVATL